MPLRKVEYDWESYYEPEKIVQPPKRPLSERRPMLNKHLRSRFFPLLGILLFVAAVVTVQAGVTASRGYELVKAQQQAEQLERENAHLRVEIAKLKSPDRIRQIATDRLGMSMPKNVYFANEVKAAEKVR